MEQEQMSFEERMAAMKQNRKEMNGCLQLVEPIAKQFENQGLSLAELDFRGKLGLLTAAETFDEKKHKSFIKYATWWIHQSIMQALAENIRKNKKKSKQS